jgi:hypothetical protein
MFGLKAQPPFSKHRSCSGVCGMTIAQPGQAIRPAHCFEETSMAVLVVALVLVLIGTLPVYPYSREWGYYPSGILTVAVAAVALTLL